MKKTFESELKDLLNRYSKENGSNTPDYILTNYIINCLEVFDVAIEQRENFYRNKEREYKKVTNDSESFQPTY